jgi:hypothetical protein
VTVIGAGSRGFFTPEFWEIPANDGCAIGF